MPSKETITHLMLLLKVYDMIWDQNVSLFVFEICNFPTNCILEMAPNTSQFQHKLNIIIRIEVGFIALYYIISVKYIYCNALHYKKHELVEFHYSMILLMEPTVDFRAPHSEKCW